MQISVIIHVSNNAKKDEVACSLSLATIYAESVISDKGPSGVNGIEELHPKFVPDCFKSAFIKVNFDI